MEPDISLIVPVFNVEDYLSECLESIERNISHFNYGGIQVIIVDDGSSDNSPIIAKKFVSKNSYFEYYWQYNQGLSAARNFGLTKARGKYIFFLDSDDTLAEFALNEMFQYTEKNHCDITQCGMLYAYEDGHSYVSGDTKGFRKNFNLSVETAMELLVKNYKIKSFACGKLYRRDLILGKPFKIGRFFEDMFWQPMVMSNCRIYGVINKPLYIYRQRTDSITGCFSLKKLDLLDGYISMIDLISRKFPQLYKQSVYSYWKIKKDFDKELMHYSLQISPKEQKRIENINRYSEDLFSLNLNKKATYLLHKKCPTVFNVVIKMQNAKIKISNFFNL